MNSQSQGAYTNEMDLTQTNAPPAGQPYTTTETTTTTHTPRSPHHSTTAGSTGTSGGVVGGEKKSLGQKAKDVMTIGNGMVESMRGATNKGLDNMMGDVSSSFFLKPHKRTISICRPTTD